jgi:hypothetical protein
VEADDDGLAAGALRAKPASATASKTVVDLMGTPSNPPSFGDYLAEAALAQSTERPGPPAVGHGRR